MPGSNESLSPVIFPSSSCRSGPSCAVQPLYYWSGTFDVATIQNWRTPNVDGPECCIMMLGLSLSFLLKKPSDLLALTITFSACLFQLRLVVNSTPRYGWLSNASSVFLLLILYWMLNWVLFPSLTVNTLHLSVLNDSLPLGCPPWQFVWSCFVAEPHHLVFQLPNREGCHPQITLN